MYRCYLENMQSYWEDDLAESDFQAQMICKEVKDGLPIMVLNDLSEESMSTERRGRKLEPVPEEEEEEEIKSAAGEHVEDDGLVAGSDGVDLDFTLSVDAREKPRKCDEVIVSHVESRREVWVQKVAREQELDSMLEELQTLKPNLELVKAPQLGDFVATTFSEDGELYRARVVSISPPGCTVIFVDFGNSEAKDEEELFQLPDHLNEEKLPAFAERVTLAENGDGWSIEQLCSFKGEVVAMSMNSIAEAVLRRVDTDQGNPEEKSAQISLPASETAMQDVKKKGQPLHDADQGNLEEGSDENNNLPSLEGAVETTKVNEMDLPPHDSDQAAEASGADVEEGHAVTTSPTVQVESRGDSQKHHQIINSSSSHMRRTPSTTIIDASDGEECDSDADVEPTLSFAAEQEAAAGAEEKFKQSLESSLLEPEIERTLSLPQWSVEDDPGSLKDLAQAEAVQVVDKLMAENECREDKEEILARLQSANLLHLAIDPDSSQVVHCVFFDIVFLYLTLHLPRWCRLLCLPSAKIEICNHR